MRHFSLRPVGFILAGICCTSIAQAQMPLTYAPDAAPGILALPPVTQPAAPAGYTLSPTTEHIHGYLSTGLSTGGGRGVEGGVVLPIVAGKAELEVGGGTGQFPVWTANGKTKTATTNDYYAALHLHPTADVNIDVAISDQHIRGPRFLTP